MDCLLCSHLQSAAKYTRSGKILSKAAFGAGSIWWVEHPASYVIPLSWAQWLSLLWLQNDFSCSFPSGCQGRMQTRQGQLSCQKQSVQLLCQSCILCTTPILPEHWLGWAFYCPLRVWAPILFYSSKDKNGPFFLHKCFSHTAHWTHRCYASVQQA